MKYALVVLNRYPDLAQRLVDSIIKHETKPPPTLIVCDGHDGSGIKNLWKGALTVCAPIGDFCYARNANLGIQTFSSHDIILINDDVEIVEKDTFARLAEAAYEMPSVGILSPTVDGGVGNMYQSYHRIGELWPDDAVALAIMGNAAPSLPVCFVCAYLKRKAISKIGLLDEDFIYYGFDDDDYCIRARRLGIKTAVYRLLHVKHGSGGAVNRFGENFSVSYCRSNSKRTNLDLFVKKHGPLKLA